MLQLRRGYRDRPLGKKNSVKDGLNWLAFFIFTQGRIPEHQIVESSWTLQGVTLSELFMADEIFKDANAYDKTLLEKLRLIDSLDEVEKKSIYNIVDSLIAKKKLKDNLSNLVAS